MEEPNSVDNPVFEKDSNSVNSVATEHRLLIVPEVSPMKDFAGEFGKGFFAMKVVNWILLVLLTILSTVLATWWLQIDRWSHWYNKTVVPMISVEEFIRGEVLAALSFLMAVLATVSLGVHQQNKTNPEKSKHILSGLALADIIFTLYFLVTLAVLLPNFALRSTSEFLWFYPRLTNGTSLADLTETSWKSLYSQSSHYNYDRYGDYYYDRTTTTTTTTTTTIPPSTTFEPHIVSEMEGKRRSVIARLIMDPTVTLIVILAIILNIVYIFRIRRAIKRTKLWDTYLLENSTLGISYGSLWTSGLTKIAKWVIPAFLFFAVGFNLTRTSDQELFPWAMIICFGIFFIRWVCYVKNVRFRGEDLDVSAKEKQLLNFIKLNLLLNSLGFVFFLVVYQDHSYSWGADVVVKTSSCAMLLFAGCIAGDIYLLYKHGVLPRFKLSSLKSLKKSFTCLTKPKVNFPRISVKVFINKETDTDPELKFTKIDTATNTSSSLDLESNQVDSVSTKVNTATNTTKNNVEEKRDCQQSQATSMTIKNTLDDIAALYSNTCDFNFGDAIMEHERMKFNAESQVYQQIPEEERMQIPREQDSQRRKMMLHMAKNRRHSQINAYRNAMSNAAENPNKKMDHDYINCVGQTSPQSLSDVNNQQPDAPTWNNW